MDMMMQRGFQGDKMIQMETDEKWWMTEPIQMNCDIQ